MTSIESFNEKLQEYAAFQSWSSDKTVVIKLIIPVSEYDNLLEQAKLLHKQEIIDARQDGINRTLNGYGISNDEYYQETFKRD